MITRDFFLKKFSNSRKLAMKLKKYQSAFITAALVCCFSGLASSLTLRVEAENLLTQETSNDAVPEIEDNPGRRESAGRRGECFRGNKTLNVLIPSNDVLQTTSAYLHIFFYIPATPDFVKEAEFILLDENQREVYKTTFTLPKQQGIFSFKIPPVFVSPTLEIGHNYSWQFIIFCDRNSDGYLSDLSGSLIRSGIVKRVALSSNILRQLEESNPLEQVEIYAQAGIWQEALTSLALLRLENPQDPILAAKWIELLTNHGLEHFAQEPIIVLER